MEAAAPDASLAGLELSLIEPAGQKAAAFKPKRRANAWTASPDLHMKVVVTFRNPEPPKQPLVLRD